MSNVLGASLQRRVQGTDSEPHELSLKHGEGVRDAFAHPKDMPLYFCKKAVTLEVPGQSSCTDTTEGQKPKAAHL
jgi:hypothetical protein